MAQNDDKPPLPKITALTCVAAVAFTLLWQEGGAVGAMRMNPDAVGREPWRLITSTFAHGGILHLGFNVYWLWRLGRELEARLAPGLYLGLLGLTAFGAAAAQYAVGTGGIGLSGVGYGLVGFLGFAAKRRAEFAGTIDTRTVRLFVGWFFLCIVLTELGIYPVANTAHATGAVLGVLAAHAYVAEGSRRWLRGSVLALGLAACLAAPSVIPITWLAKRDLYRKSAERIERESESGAPSKLVSLAQAALERDDTDTLTWPGADYFWYVSAYYKQELGLDEEAVAEAQRALELNPDLAGPGGVLVIALYRLAVEAIEAERDERAVELLREVLKLNVADLNAWELLAELHARLGHDELAEHAAHCAAALR